MDESKALKILQEMNAIRDNNCLYNISGYLNWHGEETAILDGDYKPEKLEAIAWWMKNKKVIDGGGD